MATAPNLPPMFARRTAPAREHNWLAYAMAATFAGSGAGKLLGIPIVKDSFRCWGYPRWFRYAVGAYELTAAALLLSPRGRRLGKRLLWPMLVGAAFTHIKTPPEQHLVAGPLVTAAILSDVPE